MSELRKDTAAFLVARVDGAARGNPGPASYAVILEDAAGNRVAELSGTLGSATNNVAEYRALLAALEYAVGAGARGLEVRTYSELMARQMTGAYRVRNAGLRPLHERARLLAGRVGEFRIVHVRRAENRDADRLANEALDAAAAPTEPTG